MSAGLIGHWTSNVLNEISQGTMEHSHYYVSCTGRARCEMKQYSSRQSTSFCCFLHSPVSSACFLTVLDMAPQPHPRETPTTFSDTRVWVLASLSTDKGFDSGYLSLWSILKNSHYRGIQRLGLPCSMCLIYEETGNYRRLHTMTHSFYVLNGVR